MLFLTGGPPQLDTWDLKPAAPERIRGELKPIATNVAGIQISELFPRLAQHADKLCIVRSVTHPDRTHTSAGYTMLTGMPHPLANAPSSKNIKPSPHDHPHVGSLLARVRPPRGNVPAFVSLPEIIKDAGVNQYPGLDGGLLGNQYSPIRIEANPARTGFLFPDVFLPPGVTARRLADRRVLLDQLDLGARRLDADSVKDMDGWYQKAFDALRSPAVREAFALEREPLAVREAYGDHLFGQGCLLARRLLQAAPDWRRSTGTTKAPTIRRPGTLTEQLPPPAPRLDAADRSGVRRVAGGPEPCAVCSMTRWWSAWANLADRR